MSASYTAAERRVLGKRLAKARDAQAEALRIASVMAQSAAAEGVAETQIAEQLGVDRMTVRKWVGKRHATPSASNQADRAMIRVCGSTPQTSQPTAE